MARIVLLSFAAASLALAGCDGTKTKVDGTPGSAKAATPATAKAATDAVAAERAKLPAAERELVEKQEWCAVQTDNRLGVMGEPIRVEVEGEPVFLCCEGCVKKAKADPEKTLAAVAELKAKAAKN